jgi:hypothetical protein
MASVVYASQGASIILGFTGAALLSGALFVPVVSRFAPIYSQPETLATASLGCQGRTRPFLFASFRLMAIVAPLELLAAFAVASLQAAINGPSQTGHSSPIHIGAPSEPVSWLAALCLITLISTAIGARVMINDFCRIAILIVDRLSGRALRDRSRKLTNASRPAVTKVFVLFGVLFGLPAVLNLVRWIHGFDPASQSIDTSPLADLAARFIIGLPLHAVEFAVSFLAIPIPGIIYALLYFNLRRLDRI